MTPAIHLLMGSNIAFAAALLLTLSTAAHAGKTNAPQLFQPDAKWVVDFDDQRCFAARRFRSPSEALVFGISPWPMFDWAKFVVEKPGSADGIIPLKGKVTIGDKVHNVVMMAADSTNAGRIIYTFTLPGEAIEQLKANQRVRVEARQLNADVPLTGLAPVIAKLDECIPLLLEHWGHSKEKQAVQASYPAHATRQLPLKAGDYPASAIRRGAVGVVEVLLNVGVDGKPLDCKVIRSSGHKDLDDTTCEKLLRRGNFKPGRDRNGKAVVSPFYFAVNWVMPG